MLIESERTKSLSNKRLYKERGGLRTENHFWCQDSNNGLQLVIGLLVLVVGLSSFLKQPVLVELVELVLPPAMFFHYFQVQVLMSPIYYD